MQAPERRANLIRYQCKPTAPKALLELGLKLPVFNCLFFNEIAETVEICRKILSMDAASIYRFIYAPTITVVPKFAVCYLLDLLPP